MNKKEILLSLLLMPLTAFCQTRYLSLDSCISMALQNNKQLKIARLNVEIAENTRKEARTKYLPQFNALGGYVHTGRTVSLLNDDQKATLGNLGTTLSGAIQQKLQGLAPVMEKIEGILPGFSQLISSEIAQLGPTLNSVGGGIRDAFNTNTKDMFGGAITLTQPIYMGNAIRTGNKMADIAEEISKLKVKKTAADAVFAVQNAYYLVVEVEHKKSLADEYVALIGKLQKDVEKMVKEGVATKADGLKVSVRLNEAEMAQLQAEDGLALSKMVLCKLCGLPLDTDIKVDTTVNDNTQQISSANNRPELQLLGKAVQLYDQKIKMQQAERRPQVAFIGSFFATNPSVYNGFENKLKPNWAVGLMVKLPVWDWNANHYKVNSAKAQSTIARMELSEAEELIDLQINQNRFKLTEAEKKNTVAVKNFENAQENLRCANLGFAEGVMTTTDVMMAQTAWLQAKTQIIESEIGVITAKLALNHAYGN
ncbi:MAG: TolC family protein [Bacteroidaceae bacterium]|nr:TolC family protein [Bacteroidaceae bacterium]